MNIKKNLEINLLLDFYHFLLTEKQKGILNKYYREDNSLAEIGESLNISRQAVLDAIKTGEGILINAESKFHLKEKYHNNASNIYKIIKLINNGKYTDAIKSISKLKDNL